MKKVLSIVLALAMVISCLTVVSFAQTGAGIEISGDGTAHYMRIGSGVGDAMSTAIASATGGEGSLKFNVYNTGTKTMGLKIYFQNGWGTINTTTATAVVEPGYAEQFVVPFKVQGGKLVDNSGAQYDLSGITMRFDLINPDTLNNDSEKVTNGAKFIIESLDFTNDFMDTMSTNGRTKTKVTSVPKFVKKPVAPAEVVNGNAETGTTKGWSVFSNGGVTNVEGGANGTAHAIKYAGATNQYGSVGFDFGPAIIKDEANNYKSGTGAGTYKISFYAKAEAGKGGKFSVLLNSQEHLMGNQVKDLLTGEAKDNAVATFITASDIDMTDTWQKFEVEIPVSQEFVDTILAVYAAGKTNAYKLILRLDGSNGRAFETSQFAYFVDEVTIEKVVVSEGEGTGTGTGAEGGEESATPTPTPTPKVPTGFKITYNEDTSGAHYVKTNTGVFTDADVKDGEITKKFVVVNNGEEDIKVKVDFQVFHNKSWVAPVYGTPVTIEPGDSAELEYTVEVEDGKVTVGDVEYPIADLFVRFDFDGGVSAQLYEGTSATVYCESAIAEAIVAGGRAFANESTLELVYGKNSNSVGTGDVLPVAFIALTVVATVALAVVCKKRREEF